MAYVTIAELKDYRGIDQGADDAVLERLLNFAEAVITAKTRRIFEAATQTRYYRRAQVDGKVLYLDMPLLTVTTLKNADSGQTTITSAEYWLLPRNGGGPYYAIELKSAGSWSFATDGEIELAGTWGDRVTAPEDIKQAAIRIVAWAYAQRDTQVFETTLFPDMGMMQLPAGFPADVLDDLRPWKTRARWR